MKCRVINSSAAPSLTAFGVVVADVQYAESNEDISISLWINSTLYECAYEGMSRNTEYNCTAEEWVMTENVCDSDNGIKLVAENADTDAVFIDAVFMYYEGTKYSIDAFCISDQHTWMYMTSYSPDSCDSGYSAWDIAAIDSDQMWTTKAIYSFDLEDSDISYDALAEDASDLCIVPDSCSCPTVAPSPVPTTEPTQNVYVDVDNGPGCGNLTVPFHECLQAIESLGYVVHTLQYGSFSWAPYGCFVGHPVDNWQYAYWNSQDGQTGRDVYRSVCYATGIVQLEFVHETFTVNMLCYDYL